MTAVGRRAPVLLLGLAIALSAVTLAVAQWNVTYFQDTFAFLLDRQDFSADAILTPHNEHISILPVLLTKLLLEVFGMTSNTPEQVMMAMSLFAVAILLFVYVRRRAGGWLALIAATLLLFLGSAWPTLLWPFQIQFTLPVALGLAGLLLLERDDRRGDAWACAMLSLAVISGSLGITFCVAAFVNFLQRLRERGWARIFVVAVPALIFLAWYLGWGHEAETHLTLDNVLGSPLYVMEGFASSVGALAGLNTAVVEGPARNDWGRPLLLLAISTAVYAAWRQPGVSRWFWVIATAALSYWLLAAFNYIPGREAAATRYIYPGAVFLLAMAAELLRGWRPSRNALVVVGAVALLAIGPNLAKLREGSLWEKEQSVLTRADLAALEIARATVSPQFSLGSPEVAGTASLSVVQAGKYLEAVDRWGSPAYSPRELAGAPAIGRRHADLVLGQALPVSTATEVDVFDRTGGPGAGCVALAPGEVASAETPIGPGETRIEVAPGPAAEIKLRRFATGEHPVRADPVPGRSTTRLNVPADAAARPWFVKVEARQAVRVCPAN